MLYRQYRQYQETHGPRADQLHPNLLQRHAVLSKFILSKYQMLEDKICILDFGGNSIQRGRKTSEENKDILQDFPHEWVYNISSDIQNTRQNWIKSCSISGVKASAYTLPNMGPYPECKPGPYPSHSIASGTWWILQPWCSTIHDEVWRVTMTHSSCVSH